MMYMTHHALIKFVRFTPFKPQVIKGMCLACLYLEFCPLAGILTTFDERMLPHPLEKDHSFWLLAPLSHLHPLHALPPPRRGFH